LRGDPGRGSDRSRPASPCRHRRYMRRRASSEAGDGEVRFGANAHDAENLYRCSTEGQRHRYPEALSQIPTWRVSGGTGIHHDRQFVVPRSAVAAAAQHD
jgi:hypothetical protein